MHFRFWPESCFNLCWQFEYAYRPYFGWCGLIHVQMLWHNNYDSAVAQFLVWSLTVVTVSAHLDIAVVQVFHVLACLLRTIVTNFTFSFLFLGQLQLLVSMVFAEPSIPLYVCLCRFLRYLECGSRRFPDDSKTCLPRLILLSSIISSSKYIHRCQQFFHLL